MKAEKVCACSCGTYNHHASELIDHWIEAYGLEVDKRVEAEARIADLESTIKFWIQTRLMGVSASMSIAGDYGVSLDKNLLRELDDGLTKHPSASAKASPNEDAPKRD